MVSKDGAGGLQRAYTSAFWREILFCLLSVTMNASPPEPVMPDYLLKTEPSEYSFADLQRDGTTLWDGVSNPVALRNMAGMKPGDRLVIYHTGDEKSAVGTATVVSLDASNPKAPQLHLKAAKAIARPVSLAQVKANKLFAG